MSKPEFHLQRIASDGAVGPVEVFPVTRLPDSAQMGRRGFLGAGLAVGGVLALTSRPAAAANGTVVYAHPKAVTTLAFSPDGKVLATGSDDTKVKVWGIPGGTLRQVFGEQGVPVNCLTFAPNGKAIATASGDKYIRVFETGGANMRVIHAHANWVTSLAYSPDGGTLASASFDKMAKLWSTATGKHLRTMEAHKVVVLTCAFSPDGKTLATGSQDETVKLWDLTGKQAMRNLPGHTNWVGSVAFAPNGKVLASASFDKTVRLWSVSDGRVLRTLTGHSNWVRAVAYTPDGTALVTGSADKSVIIWNPADGKDIRTLNGHAAGVRAVAVSPDGKLLASGDDEGTVIVWELATGKKLWYLFDPKASQTDGYTYKITDKVTGTTVTYTVPCGSPIPEGAECTCNCVAGTYRAPVFVVTAPPEPREPAYQFPDDPGFGGGFGGGWGGGWGYGGGGGGGGGGSYCSCNLICTCIPVCQALRLLHPDPLVANLAEELLLVMGEQQFGYMTWAANRAEEPLRDRIHAVMESIRNGARPTPTKWPAVQDCERLLDDEDEVIGIMAAQAIALRGGCGKRVHDLLRSAAERPWYLRG